MKMTEHQISAVASMLTEHPDIFNESIMVGGNGESTDRQTTQLLSTLTGIKDQRRLQELTQEYSQFIHYRPTLKAQGDEQAVKAFITYKKTGQMPGSNDPAELDQRGGDFRSPPDKAVTPGRLQQGMR